MTVAELFVNIGVKGADVTVRTFQGVKGALTELKDTSLETKAAILAILYGVQHFTGLAGERGMELKKFANYTGLSADMLQKWQYALRQSGVEAKDVESTITGLQNTLLKIQIGGAAPVGMQRVAQVVGLDRSKITDAMYMMEKLREYAQKEKNVALANEMLTSFGLSPAVIQALRTNTTALSSIAPSKILSDRDVTQLDKVNKAWLEFGHTLEIFGQKFVAAHGLQIVKDIMKITDQVLRLAEALIKLAQVFKIFSLIEGTLGVAAKTAGGAANIAAALGGSHPITNALKAVQRNNKGYGIEDLTKSIEVNVHNHGVKDMHEGAEHVHKAVKGAFYKLQSQSMVT